MYAGVPYGGGIYGGPAAASSSVAVLSQVLTLVPVLEPPMLVDRPYGSTVRARIVVLDADTGYAVDPTTMQLLVGPTNGVAKLYLLAAMVRDGLGDYHVDLGPLTTTGRWVGTWTASGAAAGSASFGMAVSLVR